MGFRIDIGAVPSIFTQYLQVNPFRVLERPYPGYLLFLFDLVSETDAATMRWFRENVEQLDMMTSKEVAFAIFAQEVRFRHHVGDPPRRPPKDIEAEAVEHEANKFDAHYLITSGRYDWSFDGEEIYAVNNAVYKVAREFGVTQDLPCIIALDGLPDPDTLWQCFPLHNTDLSTLYSSLRRAVGKLQTHPKLGEYTESLAGLRAAAERRSVVRMGSARRFPDYDIHKALTKADEGHLQALLKNMLSEYPDRGFQEEFTRRCFPKCAVWAGAVREMGEILKFRWPLGGTQETRAQEVCARIESSLLDEPSGYPYAKKQEVVALMRRLERKRDEWIQEAINGLAPIRSWIISSTPEFNEKLETELTRIDLDIHGRAREILAMADRPSWCRILAAELGHAPAEDEGSDNSALLDWVSVPEVMHYLRKMDLTGIIRMFRNAAARFGRQARTRKPTAFASYASADWSEVLGRVQGMRAFQPSLDVFLDFHSLNPGEKWKERLPEEIEQRDRFFLFWSKAASKSIYVREEWQIALKCNKPITPVPLCSPNETPPPEELADLHFNDCYQEFLRYSRLQSTSA